MSKPLNLFAARSLERVAALSDGLFAFAMTLIVLDVRVPAAGPVHSERDLWSALVALFPKLLTYFMSFITLGIFWVGQQTQLNSLASADRNLAWIYIAFLFGVSTTPFSTSLLAEFITYRIALLAYWLNILFLGTMLLVSWRYAKAAGLLKDDIPVAVSTGMTRRIVLAQAFYALGASLCAINTYWSIAVIFLVQLNFAIAPRIRFLYRI